MGGTAQLNNNPPKIDMPHQLRLFFFLNFLQSSEALHACKYSSLCPVILLIQGYQPTSTAAPCCSLLRHHGSCSFTGVFRTLF